jgi:outer membrane protein assembly factor BamB
MTADPAAPTSSQRALRLWPGVVLAAFLGLARWVLPFVVPAAAMYSVLAGLAGGVLVIVWWAFFSRAPRLDRWGGATLMLLAILATRKVLDPSIATGAMGTLFYLYALPGLGLAFVAWAVATRRLSARWRRVTMVATILLACGGWGLLRTAGFKGDGDSDFAWRWSPTAEERLLARAGEDPDPREGAALIARAAREPEWGGFRGPHRDGVVSGARVATDWSVNPPVELWRHPVGPGWSSFAVRGNRLYTQEQRGDDEVVAAYDKTSGEAVWIHRDAARFWESNAGPGPRGTPTLRGDRVYTLGGTGVLNALDAYDGSVIWTRNAAEDTGAKLPGWGFASSPLVVDDLVIVATSGALVAYNVATGEPRWFGPGGGEGYSSPQLATIDGVTQVLQLNGDGVAGVVPADGSVLWEHAWPGYPIVQPALTRDGDVLIAVTSGSGTRRLAVTKGAKGWSVEELWTSSGLKPYFDDFVLHRGYAYGFDGRILACIDLEDGQRKWKGGRYGNGQLVLLPDQDLLLVLSEDGELALVKATPDQFAELARVPAIEGKTWNHPVLVGDLLIVRNGREMAAFRLPAPAASRHTAKTRSAAIPS